MKKIISICLSLFLLVGCSQSAQSATDKTMELLNESMTLTHSLQNYSKNELAKFKISTEDQTILETFSKMITQINNIDNLGEGNTKLDVSVEGVGESSVEVWTKEGKFYILSDGTRTIQEGSFEEYEKQLGESDFTSIVEQLDYRNGVVKQSDSNTVIEFKLNDEQINQILSSQGQYLTDVKYDIKTNSMKFILNQDNYLVEMHLELLLEITDNDTKMTAEVVLNSILSDIGSTEVEFPNDLENFANKEVNESENKNELMKQLMSVANYEEIEPSVVQYDWGTEIYQFNFKKSEFNYITANGTYTYNWRDNTSNLGGVCTYNFQDAKNIGCSDEQVANIQLAKELFEQECQFSGVSPSSLN